LWFKTALTDLDNWIKADSVFSTNSLQYARQSEGGSHAENYRDLEALWPSIEPPNPAPIQVAKQAHAR
jgi:hypothetical protein